MADWKAIKTEYITTETSYRKLAARHGLGLRTISEKAQAEKWVEQRNNYRAKAATKMLDKIADKQAARAARYMEVADKLLEKIEGMADDALKAADIRSLTAAMRDIKEIQGIKHELDRREQEARIANLQRQAESDGAGDKTAVLVVEGLPEVFKT